MGPFDDLTVAQREQLRDAHATRKEAEADRRWREGVELHDRMHRVEERLAAGLREHVAEETPRRTDRGTCSVCDRPDRKLNKDGTVRHHSPEESRGSSFLSERVYRCPGSGEKPKEG